MRTVKTSHYLRTSNLRGGIVVTGTSPASSPTSFTSLLTNLAYQPPHQPPYQPPHQPCLPASSPSSSTSLLTNLLTNLFHKQFLRWNARLRIMYIYDTNIPPLETARLSLLLTSSPPACHI